ncbi:GATA transcription factor 7-like [Carica papaya]|uniref:GATA transcription factor 7-like n=1 Tax=Carica papaya TaxID=3649 RepID=UPI000B8CF71F|nr:GATA transcription factor 7-like [Carica papaya]
MAIDDINYDTTDLSDLFPDHLYSNLDYIDPKPDPLPAGFTYSAESQLCVPQDTLEDLEWFPSFTDDFINLSGISLENETLSIKGSSYQNDVVQEPLKLENSKVSGDQNEASRGPGNFEYSKSFSDQNDASQEPAKLENSIDRPVTPELKTEDTFGRANKRRREAEIEESEKLAFGFCSSGQKKQRSKRDSCGKHERLLGWAVEKAMTSGTMSFGVTSGATSFGVTERRKRCSHCLSDKTPQWRIGPMGPKTLCNACGVRYKSGRLIPEYRPAASPTFNILKHSNFHKKILKRREFNGC